MSGAELRDRIEAELVEALDTETRAADPEKIGERLARTDHGDRALVGLAGQLPMAVTWSGSRRQITAVVADSFPIDGRRRVLVSTEDASLDVPSWIRDQGEAYWTWLHPRYRWVFE